MYGAASWVEQYGGYRALTRCLCASLRSHQSPLVRHFRLRHKAAFGPTLNKRKTCGTTRPGAVLPGALVNLASTYLRMAGFRRRVWVSLWLGPAICGHLRPFAALWPLAAFGGQRFALRAPRRTSVCKALASRAPISSWRELTKASAVQPRSTTRYRHADGTSKVRIKSASRDGF